MRPIPRAAYMPSTAYRPPVFTPHRPPRICRYWVDVPALAVACGLPPSTPLLDLVAPAGEPPLPRDAAVPRARPPPTLCGGAPSLCRSLRWGLSRKGGWARQAQALSQYLEFPIAPEHHLQYAATWVTLATATAIIARRAITAPARQNLRRQQMAGAAAASDARKTTTS